MATNSDKIHEGVKKDITITPDTDTSNETINLYAFNLRNSNDEGKLLGSVSGDVADTGLVFTSCATDELSVGIYLLEAWIDPDSEDRQCIFPNDEDTYQLEIIDRRKVDI